MAPKEAGPIVGLCIAGLAIWSFLILFFLNLDFVIKIPLLILLALIHFAIIFAAYSRKTWTLKMAKAVAIVSLLYGVITLSILTLLIYGVLLWWITKPVVKEAFK